MQIAGVDDAGRGPIIGPLVIAGVLFDDKDLSRLIDLGVKDSKRLLPRRREHLAAEIKKLALKFPIRIITTRNDYSEAFLSSLPQNKTERIAYRFAKEEYHEKGLLAPYFYIEGSMNFTYHGIYINGEKITYHCVLGDQGQEKISRAYLEFDRRWEILSK